MIEPVLRNGSWTNDRSEIRKANYNYWTIGHIMATGLIDSRSEQPHKFKEPENFLEFYSELIKKTSKSPYEKEICDRYINY